MRAATAAAPLGPAVWLAYAARQWYGGISAPVFLWGVATVAIGAWMVSGALRDYRTLATRFLVFSGVTVAVGIVAGIPLQALLADGRRPTDLAWALAGALFLAGAAGWPVGFLFARIVKAAPARVTLPETRTPVPEGVLAAVLRDGGAGKLVS